jgi:hypothetical protein
MSSNLPIATAHGVAGAVTLSLFLLLLLLRREDAGERVNPGGHVLPVEAGLLGREGLGVHHELANTKGQVNRAAGLGEVLDLVKGRLPRVRARPT